MTERFDEIFTHDMRLMILTIYTRPIWSHHPIANGGIEIAMNQL